MVAEGNTHGEYWTGFILHVRIFGGNKTRPHTILIYLNTYVSFRMYRNVEAHYDL